MTDAFTTAQMMAFFWEGFRSMGTVLFLITGYFIKGVLTTQKEQGDKLGQVMIDMQSLKDSNHALSLAINASNKANEKAISQLVEAQKQFFMTMEINGERTASLFVEKIGLVVDNKIMQNELNKRE